MRARDFLQAQLAKWDAPRQQAIRLSQFGDHTIQEIAQATGLSDKEVVATIDGFNEQCEKELIPLIKAGLRFENTDFSDVRLDHT